MVIQIFIGSYIPPMSQLKARMVLKASDINFFSSLIKEGKFINAVQDLTIFIDKKNEDGSCLLYTSPSPRDRTRSRMPSSA